MKRSIQLRVFAAASVAAALVAFQNCTSAFQALGGSGSSSDSAIASAAQRSVVSGDGLEIGGSNFVTYSVTNYPQDTSLWYQPLVLRPVIGTYHHDPERVKAELTVMRNRGQRKIALVLWYSPLGNMPNSFDGVWGHIVASDAAALPPQQQQNLRSLLGLIDQLGFDEVQLRFATQGTSDPGGWPSWNEAQYQQNWNFVWNTRNLMESALANSNVRRVYDLGLEMAGITSGQTEAYVHRLWSDYTYATGYNPSDTYGFSVIPDPGRLARFIQNLATTGYLPSSYGFDVYDSDSLSALTQLSWLATDLQATGEISKNVIIQETLYNDAKSYQQFLQAKNDLGMKIRTIMQWPNSRESKVPAFDRDYAKDLDNYVPDLRSQGARVEANPAVCTILPERANCTTALSWSVSQTGAPGDLFVSDAAGNGAQLFASGHQGTSNADWIQPGASLFRLWMNQAPVTDALVYGVPLRGKLASSSPSGTCQITNGQGTCALDIFWSVPDAQNEVVSVFVRRGSEMPANGFGALFAQSGTVGKSNASWIVEESDTFVLVVGGKVLDTLAVRAVR